MEPRVVSSLIHDGYLTAALGESHAQVTLDSIRAYREQFRTSRPASRARS
ncbi:hypothetical protein [Streptomyces sp. NPDC015125]